MTLATYAAPVAAHPTRTGARRGTNAIRLLILHTSEGSEGTASAEALARFIASPRSATNLASYHYVFDTDRVIPLVPDDYVAYATGGANHDGLAACYPGKAAQTPEQWADDVSSAMHEQAARWLADKSQQYGIPLRKLTFQQVRDGYSGVCGHIDVTLAYGKSTHTDPGPYFPWDRVIGRARGLADISSKPTPIPPPIPIPSEDDEMITGLWKGPNDPGVYQVCSNRTKIWCYPDTVDEAQALLRVEGKSDVINVQESAQMFRAFGPVIGPRPEGVDEYGWKD